MRFQIILALGLIAAAAGTPLLDKKHASSMKVIDIPADLFADASDITEEVVKAPAAAESVATVEKAASEALPVEEVKASVVPEEVAVVATSSAEDTKKVEGDAAVPAVAVAGADNSEEKKGESGETEDVDRPSIFGFRLPTIVVLRRPQVFDEPFPFFPFLNFNRRPAPPSFEERIPNRRVETRDGIVPLSAAAAPSERRPVSAGGNAGISDVMFNMRQQMDSIFSSLFAPNPGYFPNRQFFPRPFFPQVPSDSSAEDSVDFDKLPNNYKNSTSETKIIDGRVVQVNKTIHKIGGDNSNGFFQFSVIKIRPEETPESELKPEEAEAVPVPPAAIGNPEIEKAPESSFANDVTTAKAAEQEAEMNNPSLNEVDQEKKETVMTQTKYETDPGLLEESSPSAPVPMPLAQEVIYDFVPLKASMPLIKGGKGKPLDLSSDLRVNNLMANEETGRLRSLVDPDEIEIIEV